MIGQDFGWKKKAEKLRMVLLSAGHQLAKPLAPGITQVLAAFRRVAQTGDWRGLQEEFEAIPKDAETPLWEPAEIYGWKLQATLYLDNGQLYWLVHAVRINQKTPVDKDIRFLDKVLEHLGADPARDMIIGPRSSPAGEPPLAFGWWSWFNKAPLFEIQVSGRGNETKMRVVPIDTPESDGYVRLDRAVPPAP